MAGFHRDGHKCKNKVGHGVKPKSYVVLYFEIKIAQHIIKIHGSESRGQEEAGLCDEPVSYLQVAPL